MIKEKVIQYKQDHSKNSRYQAWSFGMEEKFLSKNRAQKKYVQVKTINMSVRTKFNVQDLYVTHYTDRLEPSPLNRNIYYTNFLRAGIVAQHPEWPYILEDYESKSEHILSKDVFVISFMVEQKPADTDKQYIAYEKKGIQIKFELENTQSKSLVNKATYGIAISLDQFNQNQKSIKGSIQLIKQDKAKSYPIQFYSATKSGQIKDKINKTNNTLLQISRQKIIKNLQSKNAQQGPLFEIVSKNKENIIESTNQIEQYYKFIVEVQTKSEEFTCFFKEDEEQKNVLIFEMNSQHQKQNAQLRQIFGLRQKYYGKRQDYKHISNYKNLPQNQEKENGLQNFEEYEILQEIYFCDQCSQQLPGEQRRGFLLQGKLGNCYMISALVAIGCFAPTYILDAIIFQSKLPNICIVNLNIDGKRISILVPAVIPYDIKQRQMIYSTINRQVEDYPNSHQAKTIVRYSIYIELALAMIYRYYAHLAAGESEEIFFLLTNTPSKRYKLTNQIERKQFQRVLSQNNNHAKRAEKCLITVGVGTLIDKNNHKYLENISEHVDKISNYIDPELFEQHQYAFLDHQQLLNPQTKQTKLFFKLYNPQQNSGRLFFEKWIERDNNKDYFQQWKKYQISKYNRLFQFTSNQFLIDYELLINLRFTATVCRANLQDQYREKSIAMIPDYFTLVQFTPSEQGYYRFTYIQPNVRETLAKTIKIDKKDGQRQSQVRQIMNNYTYPSVNMVLEETTCQQQKRKMEIFKCSNIYTSLQGNLKPKKHLLKIGEYSLKNMSQIQQMPDYQKRESITRNQNYIFYHQELIQDQRKTSHLLRHCRLSILGVNALTVQINNHRPKTQQMPVYYNKEMAQMQKIKFQQNQVYKIQIWLLKKSGKFLLFKYKRHHFQGEKRQFLDIQIQQTSSDICTKNKIKEIELTTNLSDNYFLYAFQHDFLEQKSYKICMNREKKYNSDSFPKLTAELFADEERFRECYSYSRKQAKNMSDPQQA